MQIKYDIQKLQKVLDDFHNVTGFRISVLDTEFHPIADADDKQVCFCSIIQSYDNCDGCLKSDAILLKKCSKSQKAEIRICHAGLTNIALPILLNGKTIGYVIMGQVREENDYESIRCRLPANADHSKLEENYERLIYYNRSQIESAARTAVMLTISILAENMIKLEAEELSEKAVAYIEKNLCSDLSLKTLCNALNISKNLLYKNFQSKYNCTINEYITGCRIDKAKELLCTSQLSIREISEKVGLTEEAYFCRLFKRKVGCTPMQYRNAKYRCGNNVADK